jgi:hypothetical protein
MTIRRLAALAISMACWCAAQQPAPAPPAGLDSPWSVRNILDELVKQNAQLQPLLAKLNPQDWYNRKGASQAYVQQWQTARRQLNDVVITSQMLSQKTESLPLALDDYFRLEALETTVRSLEEGVRRYGERSTADQLDAAIAHNFNTRERFRDYIRDLANAQEQNFKVADEEAQRCRGMISREPAPAKRAKKY